MTQLYGFVNDLTLQAGAEGTSIGLQATGRGELRIVDFITQMLFNGRGYQIRAGTIATGVAMDAVVTDTAAEGCVDAAAGTTIVPIGFRLAFDDIATATTVKARINAVGVASSAGTAFTPLPLLQGGSAAVSTARVANNGGVTVTAELNTTTRQLFAYSNVATETPAAANIDAAGAGALASVAAAATQLRYVGQGVACVYVQLGATTAFPLYYFQLDYLEIPTINL